MTRPLPGLPHPSVKLVGADGRVTREWLALFAELCRRVPVTGTATFAAATSVAVTLPAPESDAGYRVLIEGAAARSHWPSGKTTTGFTLNASTANSDTVAWALLRT
jgi:hypothetical protein